MQAMKNLILIITAAVGMLSAMTAFADLGDSADISDQKYTPVPHDNRFDIVGEDGLLHSVDSIWSHYWDNAGHSIAHVYDRHGIAIAVCYAVVSGY